MTPKNSKKKMYPVCNNNHFLLDKYAIKGNEEK